MTTSLKLSKLCALSAEMEWQKPALAYLERLAAAEAAGTESWLTQRSRVPR